MLAPGERPQSRPQTAGGGADIGSRARDPSARPGPREPAAPRRAAAGACAATAGRPGEPRACSAAAPAEAPASSREAHHVSSTAGPPGISGRGGMNGAAANGNGHARPGPRPPGRKAENGGAAPIDFDALFSAEARGREVPKLRQLATAFNGIPGMIPLHGGLPPPSAFPLQGLQLTLKDGSTVDITDPQEVVAAQQYNLTMLGHASLLEWVREHTRRLHAPSPAHETMITGGSNYTIEMLMRVFLEPGDSMMVEEFTYPHVPESLLLPAGIRPVGCAMDAAGIIPDALLATLEGMQARGERVPRLLYTIPTGQNPTGASQTPERKRQIYAICRRFGIIILEDDPYYYLQYRPGQPPQGLQGLGPSYLSLDTDGRVCRLDSFSKVLAPGLRIAWLTAHSRVIEKVLFHFHGVAMGACSLSQVVVGALLQRLGHAGFEAHVRDVQQQYGQRAAVIEAAAAKHLAGLADWAPVTAGMFLWLRLRGIPDAYQIMGELQEAKVIVAPGHIARFSGPDVGGDCPFVRLAFVTAPIADLEVAVARLAALLRRLQAQNSPPKPLSPARTLAGAESCEVV